jgi:hypothetical protein
VTKESEVSQAFSKENGLEKVKRDSEQGRANFFGVENSWKTKKKEDASRRVAINLLSKCFR